jgi:hypothetical protein
MILTEFMWIRIGTTGYCECGNEPSSAIKMRGFHDCFEHL